MPHLSSLSDARLHSPAFVSIGVFDGLHLGHQSLLEALVKAAKAAGCQSAVVTFHPHPDRLLKNVSQRHYLGSPERRAALMLQLGVDLVITLPFDDELRRLPAADFVARLARHLRIQQLWVGADFALGFRREGDVAFLRAQGARHGFTVNAIELLASHDSQARVASSQIRALLRRGAVAQAAKLLGREYALAGQVVAGERRGRAIGFPTANIKAWQEQIVPATGVYATWAILNDQRFMAAANIGTRPTFAGDDITIEAHLLDFDGEIYGENLELRFVDRLRDEIKFESLDALIKQIGADIAMTRQLLG